MTKNRIFIALILLLLFIPTTFMLWYGEETINKKAAGGYSVFSFSNQTEIVSTDDASALDFRIDNLDGKKHDYTIKTFLNKVEVDSLEQKVLTGESATINASEKTKEAILKNNQPKTKVEYSLLIEWGKKKETLKKQLTITNEK